MSDKNHSGLSTLVSKSFVDKLSNFKTLKKFRNGRKRLVKIKNSNSILNENVSNQRMSKKEKTKLKKRKLENLLVNIVN